MGVQQSLEKTVLEIVEPLPKSVMKSTKKHRPSPSIICITKQKLNICLILDIKSQ